MKILFLTHRVPYPPNKGDKLRAFHILKYLAGRHSLYLACITENKDDLRYKGELEKYAREVEIVFMGSQRRKIKSMSYLFSKRPLTLPYFYSKELDKKIKKAIDTKKFDLIYIYSSSMAQYVLEAKGMTKIMDFIDVDSDKWRQYSRFAGFPCRIIYKIESDRLKRYEEKIAQNVDYCIAVSKEEIEVFEAFLPKEKLSAISNGVDFDYFRPRNGGYEKNSLIFSGAMDYYANVDAILYFCRHIYPLIRRDVPDIRLYIVGANPANQIKRLARDKNIIVTGFVEDIRPYLERSAVCVAPLRIGRGIRNKIIEAMSMGIPVVTMNSGLFGIDAMPGEDIIVEDKPEGFAQKTVKLLKNVKLREKISHNGRRLILEKFDWGINLEKLSRVIPDL